VIWFLRHGDAEQGDPGQPDSDRRLTKKGQRQSRVAGRALAALGVNFDACLSSPKVRAAETARIACAELGLEVTLEPALAGGDFDARALTAGYGDVLLVGHEPDFSSAIHELTGGRGQMKKGGLAAVDERELHSLLRPKQLAAIAD
jgi:phosphohistidine phosphatase